MATEWYIGFDNQVVGPVDQQQLLDFLKSSEQWRQILVWHTGLDEWKLAKDMPDIVAQIPKGPPPLPAPAPPPVPEPKSEAPSIVPAAPAETKPAEPVAAPVEAVAATAAPAVEPAPAPTMPVAPVVVATVAEKPAKAPRRWGWGATAATIVLLLGGAFVAQKLQFIGRDSATVAKATQPSSDATLERGFAEIIQNTTLPKKLDDYTTRSDVTQAGKRLVFHHILDTTRYLVPQNFAVAMKQKILPEVCTTAAREALKAGGTLEYRFHTQAAFLIGSFEIGANDCGAEQPKG